MKLGVAINKYWRRLFLCGVLLGMVLISSCRKELNYDDYVAKELASGVRNDSLIYGIHFGMTDEEFRQYCTDMNRRKLFMPDPHGSAVRIVLNEGFDKPVLFDFMPTFIMNWPITQVVGHIRYRDFSYYDKKYEVDNLIKEAQAYFEKGYGGNKFFTVPHENVLLKYMYVKIDGNRKIVLKPNFDGQQIEVEFEDLKHTIKEK